MFFISLPKCLGRKKTDDYLLDQAELPLQLDLVPKRVSFDPLDASLEDERELVMETARALEVNILSRISILFKKEGGLSI